MRSFVMIQLVVRIITTGFLIVKYYKYNVSVNNTPCVYML